jgi:hypothetical protein
MLTLKALFAVQRHAPAQWLHSAQVLDRVRQAWRDVAPLNAWLREHVGPPRA